MNCNEAIGWLVSQANSPMPEPLAHHLDRCESCRTLADAVREAQAEFAVPPPVDRIKSLLFRDLRPVKPLPSEGFLLALLLLILSAVLTIGSGLLGVHGWSSLAPYARLFIFSALLVGSCALAFAVVRQMAPGRGNILATVGSAVIAFGVLLTTISHVFHWRQEPRFVHTGLHCLTTGLIYAVVSGLLTWLVLRRGAALSSVASGTITGGLVGFVGIIGLEIVCPNPNLAHIVLWHLSVGALGVTGGWTFGVIARAVRP
jgi:negative regulator of sigma F NrsF-like protein